MSEENPQRAAVKAVVDRVKARMKITKVVCTRSVKGARGEVYVGFASAWNSVQEDAGHNLVHTGLSEEDETVQGMTTREAKEAALVLGWQVDQLAFERAMAGGVVTSDQYVEAIKALNHNYTQLIANHITPKGSGNVR